MLRPRPFRYHGTIIPWLACTARETFAESTDGFGAPLRRPAVPAPLTILLGVLAAVGIVARVGRRDRDDGSGAHVVTCAALPEPTPDATSAWLESRPPLARLHFRIYWNDYFQVHEVVFRNGYDRPIHFDVWTAAGAERATRPLRRSLGPGEQESPPSTSVVAGAVSAPVCVHLSHIRLGIDSGPLL